MEGFVMNTLFTYLHKTLARHLTLLVTAIALVFLVNPIQPYAAGMKGGNAAASAAGQVASPVNVSRDSRMVSPMTMILEGDATQDQIRLQLKDGSCEIDCDGDGIPDQDQDQVRTQTSK